jgi:WYL domain
MKKNVLPFSPSHKQTLDSQLRFAIANKRLIRFTYESVVRIAEPHDYGLRDGAPKLLAYQRQKAARKDLQVRGWRWLDVAKMQDCSVLDDSFSGTRETPNQQHHHWDVLYARVDHTMS